MGDVTNLPDKSVVIDLDALERPETDVVDPFVFQVGGRKITLADPNDVDWRDLASIELPADLLRVVMSREDRKFLQDQKLPGWKFNELMEAYQAHYKLEEKIAQAKRQALV